MATAEQHQFDASSTDAPIVEDDAHRAIRELVLGIADIVADTPAANTIVLDIRNLASFADYFLICSGENERQLRAISEQIREQMSVNGIRPTRIEGSPSSGWIVLDFGDVIVHVFDADLRAFYAIETLWSEAPTLLSVL